MKCEALKEHFNKFMTRLESVTIHLTAESLHKADSKDLIKICSTTPDLYEGIELVLRSAYVAAVKVNVESIAESVISVYIRHNSD